MTLPEVPQPELDAELDWLYARQRFGIHPGLGRVAALLGALGHPQDQYGVVLIGGTNGKGSTAAALASILHAAGLRAGLFTSPHLTHFSERFMVGGQLVSPGALLAGLRRVRPHAEVLGASFFEIVTALGCLLFAEAGVALAVMEVGLGGRLDATNALSPLVSVISNVGLDHTEILGERVEQIAAEKAGILRRGGRAVTGVEAALWPVLATQGADLWALGREVQYTATTLGWAGWALEVASPLGRLDLQTPLLGEHGAANTVLAAAAALRLRQAGWVIPDTAIAAGARTVRWPGRLERLEWAGGELLLDGAHNPDGARALRRALEGLATGPLPFIFGGAADKDLAGVVAALRPLMSRVILTRAALSPRAADPAALAPLFGELPVTLTPGPAAALAELARTPGRAVACGSLYLIGELRPLLRGEVAEGRERWQ